MTQLNTQPHPLLVKSRHLSINFIIDYCLLVLSIEDQCREVQADDNTSGINKEIKVNRHKLQTIGCVKYLGSVITDEGSKAEILCRTAQTTAALTRLK